MDKIVYDPGAIAQVVLPEDVSGLISEFISGFDLNLKSNPRYKIDKKLAYEVQKFPICLELDNKFYLAKNKDEYLKLLPSDFNEVIISRPFYISKKQDNLRFIINNNSYGFYFKKSDKTILFKLNTKFKSMSKILSFYLINDDVMILDDNEYKINKIDNAVENLFNYPKEIYQEYRNVVNASSDFTKAAVVLRPKK